MKKSITALVPLVGYAQPLSADEPVDFAGDVLPILKSRCANRHTNGTWRRDFSRDTREKLFSADDGVVVPGKIGKSALMLCVMAVPGP